MCTRYSFSSALALIFAFYILATPLGAQTTAFKYQGSLTDGGNPANGSFQMQFKLFDAVSGGVQIGSTLTDLPVTATNGVFAISLDFGSNALNGANRWLEISVRHNASESYVTLSPRERLTSSPYAVRTLSAAMADDSQKLGGVNANQFVQTNDARLSDPRNPLPGSTNYVQNTLAQQASSNFNVSGNGTATSFNVNGPFTFGNVAPPAVAPAGQSRFYFDTATNKLRVSENGAAYVNLVGATGVSGSGTVNRIPFFSAPTTLSDSVISQVSNNIGIGVTNPLSKLHILSSASVPRLESSGTTGFSAGWDFYHGTTGKGFVGVPDSGAAFGAGELILYGGGNVKSSIWANGGRALTVNTDGAIGIGTSTPHPLYRFDSFGNMRAFSNTHVNFTVETSGTNNGARINMRSATRNWFIGTSQSLNGDQFYIGEGESLTAGQRMVISTGGQFGFGTINPHPGYRADFIGGVRSTDTASTQFVAETTGGTNSWARYYMRSVNPDTTVNQGWLMGTSRDFNGNQFYLVDETFNQTRFTIQPAGGPIDHQGNVSQNHTGFGVPKAMVFINGDGSPIRCYNGVTGSSFGNCGFSVGRISTSQGSYFVDFGFSAFFRFFSVAAQSFSSPVSTSFSVDSGFPNRLTLFVYDVNTGATTDRPVMIIMY